MKLKIDLFDGAGLRDYTDQVTADSLPKIVRQLNMPDQMTCTLVISTDIPSPTAGNRVVVEQSDGGKLFTGYLSAALEAEYLGWGMKGPVYQYKLAAVGDEYLLNQRRLPHSLSFCGTSAGEIAKQILQQLGAEEVDVSGIRDCEILDRYSASAVKSWSEMAGDLALRVRGCVRCHEGKISLEPVGQRTFVIAESDPMFCPESLQLKSPDQLVNEVTVFGRSEPRTYVKDHFLGDGLTSRFGLSEIPFLQNSSVILDEEYSGASVDTTNWIGNDSQNGISVNGGKLWIAGSGGLNFARQFEISGALQFQHGEVSFSQGSSGVIGGLFSEGCPGVCIAGFQITNSGAQSQISAVVNGIAVGSSIATADGHRYGLTTRLYATQDVRSRQRFHSSLHPGGSAMGGDGITADVRVVLEIHDIDENNTASLIAPATVLFDDVVTDAPATCIYSLVSADDLHCSISYTRILRLTEATVRSALPGQEFRTRLAGSMIEGAECHVSTSGLGFYSAYIPAANEKILVSYRSGGSSSARVSLTSAESAGTRSAVMRVASPPPRTSEDCVNAAIALLEDCSSAARSGSYEIWSRYLPASNSDVFPGDSVEVNVPSVSPHFSAIVRKVGLETTTLDEDRYQLRISFANDAAEPLGFLFAVAGTAASPQITTTFENPQFSSLPALAAAELIDVTSTGVTFDTGVDCLAGGGFELRRSDVGWGSGNDRNLIGRFTTRTITVPRLARVQDFYLRQFNSEGSRQYSRFSTLLHVDYPL